MRSQENGSQSQVRRQSTDAKSEMTEMLELSDKGFKPGIETMLSEMKTHL